MFERVMVQDQLDGKCLCSHCQLGFTAKYREEFFRNYIQQVFTLVVKDNAGYIQTSNPDDVIEVIKEFSFRAIPESLEVVAKMEAPELLMNKFSTFFTSPYQFFTAAYSLREITEKLFNCFEEDAQMKAAPIVTGVLTAEILFKYFKDGELPESVKKVISSDVSLVDIPCSVVN